MEIDKEFVKEEEQFEEFLEMFIRLEICVKEYIDFCVVMGKKSYESDDIVLNSDLVIFVYQGIGEFFNQSGMFGMQLSG